jgi:hypothetical protein
VIDAALLMGIDMSRRARTYFVPAFVDTITSVDRRCADEILESSGIDRKFYRRIVERCVPNFHSVAALVDTRWGVVEWVAASGTPNRMVDRESK